jgi:hypothetical protein
MNDYRGNFSKKEKQYLDVFNGFIFQKCGDGSILAKHFSWGEGQKISAKNIYTIKASIEKKTLSG